PAQRPGEAEPMDETEREREHPPALEAPPPEATAEEVFDAHERDRCGDGRLDEARWRAHDVERGKGERDRGSGSEGRDDLHGITEARADEQHAEQEEQVVVAREDVLDAEEEEQGRRRWRLRAGSHLDLRRRTVAREDAREDLAAARVAHGQVLLVTARQRIEERRSKTQW